MNSEFRGCGGEGLDRKEKEKGREEEERERNREGDMEVKNKNCCLFMSLTSEK